ncbi:ISL3 family transposase [Acidiphilium acidophilum]|uniref:ISL3 family transposase n=1 Tax=Acidiphilium acidophilum TaxID=76588 RepID=UPI0038D18489
MGSECRDGRWTVSTVGRGSARCPGCDMRSSRRHGWQVRLLQDLPAQGTPVTLRVCLSRWRCQNQGCARKTFSDRLPKIAPPFARRTCRVADLTRLFGHAAGGRPAERLMASLGLPQSDDTILRHLKRHAGAPAEAATVRVVGVDDWAWQRGFRYGTIMVDLERREVVDVLPDRSAEATGHWLAQHPGIEIVSRDRAGLYAEGARQGAPQAKQVADRFHLLQNFQKTIEQQLSRAPRLNRQPSPSLTEAEPVIRAEWIGHGRQPALVEHRQLGSIGRRAVNTDKFNQVKALQLSGHRITAIVRQTKFSRRTVTKWVQLDALPERNVMAPKPNTPSGFHDHLARRWAEGCTSGRVLLLEIRDLGYTGSLSHLGRLLAGWHRAGRPVTVDAATAATPNLIDPLTGHLVSPIVAAALCVKPRGLLTDAQAAKVEAFKTISPAFATMRALAMRFRGILRGGDVEKLTVWLHDADLSTLYGIRRFVHTLRQDLAAVGNAITETWSNGQTEGQINRLKTLKRAMYGRAGVDLLRARMMPFRVDPNHTN